MSSKPLDSASSSTPPATQDRRVVSMDQFRGYAVAGMFVVNFLGGLQVTHHFIKHNGTHFSWADSIMPGFIFAAGFSFRLVMLKRIPRLGRGPTYRGIIKRSLALVLVSLTMYGLGGGFDSWADMNSENVRRFIAELIKADLWEVLAIIGVTQLVLLPVIELSAKARLLVTIGLVFFNIFIHWWFNYDFTYGHPNWMDDYFGAAGRRAWDGGCFGILAWAIPMLAGTLVYDLVSSRTAGKSVAPLLLWGALIMALGYGANCLTRLYDVRDDNAVTISTDPDNDFADSPVIPPWQNMEGRSLESLLAEPPFVPPDLSVRKKNYWMMDKRVVSMSFTLFATGFTLAVYALFVLACDVGSLRLGLFGMFGRNALAAYIIHHAVELMVLQIVPKDSPVWWAATGLVIFFAITWMFVRYLDKNRYYIRL